MTKKITEIKALEIFDNTLNQLDDNDARDRVLRWAFQKFASKLDSSEIEPDSKGSSKKKSQKIKKKIKKKSGSKESFSIVKDLNLRGSGKVPPMQKFYEEKKPRSNIEFNALAIYYLKNIIKVSKVTPNHVYTCYREVKRKPSDAFKQSILDTSSSRYGYIDASNLNDLKIPHRGTTFIEHDLPKKKEGKK